MANHRAKVRKQMERRNAAPLWRASLGFVVTAIAAALLIIAVWRVLDLSSEAGNTLGQLTRERTAVAYQRSLFDLLVQLERYRLRTELLRSPPFTDAVRRDVDRQMSVTANFTAAHGQTFEVAADWAAIQRRWAKARNFQRVYTGDDLHQLSRAVNDLIYKLEDTSGIEYESNRYAQDLADMLFAKTPQGVYDAAYADLISENAQISGTISIKDRVMLAGQLSMLRTDVDLSSDDWTAILKSIPGKLGTAAQAARYRVDSSAMAAAGNRLAETLNDQVLMREHPIGNPPATRAMASAVIQAAIAMNENLAVLLDRQLQLRIGYETLRNRYIYGIVLLAAMLLVGIMLLVAELTARRDREALNKAQQESARLGAELARQKAERALRLSEAQFRAVFDGAALGIAIFDRSGSMLDANAVFRNVYGDNSAGVLEGHEEEFAELMRGERDLFEFEHHVMTPSGQEAWTDSTISLVNDDAGSPYFAICMFRDLTDLKRNERRMQHDMTHDALTGLPNRALFETKVREQFAQAKTSPQLSFAVLVVDLDRFKDINESLGHEAGDFVISQVGHRLRASIEAADVVSRLGSDEFAVLVRSLPDVLHVELIARRVLSALAKPVLVGSRSIFVSASVGIAIASGKYQRGEDVMRDADIAMRYAKGSGGRFAVFDSNMHARAEKRLQLTTDLRLAIEHNEFNMLYQPIVKIA
ncbi:MAG TPA: sensor domain-containing diguanylate cyclase, partial [Candidatus Baltobacteraceae bacterium]|nr:sensor domain-containing diguanylate cyclase [Candidatus Baltobacteraceae bacterium]